ncbi:DNA pilot protein [Tortoise microvirus 26]|nr:DNA pilot protein [Tortoise microvirus 26]
MNPFKSIGNFYSDLGRSVTTNNQLTGALSGIPVLGGIFGGAYNAAADKQNYQMQMDMFNRNLQSQEYWNAQNLGFQRENLDYQKQLQQEMFGREDTAVQRRADDMLKAGLSKTLAAGGGASAGPVVSTQAPQGQAPQGQPAQRNSIQAQMSSLADLISLGTMGAQLDLLKANARKATIDADIDEYELRYAKDAGISVRNPSIFKSLSHLLGNLGFKTGEVNNIINKIEQNLPDFTPPPLPKYEKSDSKAAKWIDDKINRIIRYLKH